MLIKLIKNIYREFFPKDEWVLVGINLMEEDGETPKTMTYYNYKTKAFKTVRYEK